MFLARHGAGRCLLHLGCICRGGRVSFHLEAIVRELREARGLAATGHNTKHSSERFRQQTKKAAAIAVK